jgi:site-specific recombinase XerD
VRLTLYRRHTKTCKHKSEKDYQRCECPVWFEANVVGRRWNTETETWAQAPNESIQSRWSSKEKNWRAAEYKARQLEQQNSHPAAMSVKEAVEVFLTSKRNENLAADTVYRHEQIMKSLVEFCDRQGVIFVKDITLATLTMWQSQWTLKAPQARRSRQEKVRNFFKYCLANGMIATNPAIPDHWKSVKIKVGDQYIRAFEPSEYEQILSSIESTKMTDANKRRIRALMQLQRWSGLSLVDAVCLSKDELKLEGGRKGGTFRVILDRQKTGTLINNWIPFWLGEELLKVKNGNPEFFFWSGSTTPEDAPSYLQKLYRKVFKAAGIDGSSHDFRHTYAVELLKSGVDIRTVSKALGHSSVTITERYYSRWCTGQQTNLDNTLRSALGG